MTRPTGWPLAAGVLPIFLCALAACGAGEDASGSVSGPELMRLLAPPSDVLVIDVRTPREYDAGHVPGAVNIPHTEVADRIDEVLAGAKGRVVVYCERGGRAAKAEAVLREAGLSSLLHLEGDMEGWRAAELPIE